MFATTCLPTVLAPLALALMQDPTPPAPATTAIVLPAAPSDPPPTGDSGAVQDPTKNEVALPALAGWNATLVLDQGPVGIWTVVPMKAFAQYACPEIAALDDLGRLHLMWSYSGKWTPVTTVNDGKWLGGFVHDDLDPRLDGPEIYTGSQNGNLWEVTIHRPVFCSSRLIAQIPGREIHTLVGGDLDPRTPGKELLAFTNPGGLYLLQPKQSPEGFEVTPLGDLPGRIRDAVLLPAEPGKPREIATVGRHGRFEILTLDGGVPEWRTVHAVPMGMGRLSVREDSTPDAIVAYTVADEGRVWRHERDASRHWHTELIYVGDQGMRGCAAGRFDADPTVETVAVYGYFKRVELLSKRDDGWHVETLFVDRDKGHWIARGEFDGRNGTDELVATGYSGRIVLLSRPPGYGLPGVLTAEREQAGK
ncbi:MAG: hypothetical protein KDE27_27905 [Planctomycetes bacterium]|nr:hypothetical protein [Planctomycetota bacterium]